MLGGEHKPLKAAQEKVCTKWHSIRNRFRYLFDASHIEKVEAWYNTVAPWRQREHFRAVMKAIHLHEPQPAPDALTEHRASNVVRLYGEVLTPAAAAKAKSWVMHAPVAETEHFRDVFAAVQSMLTTRSTTKAAFVAPASLPAVQPKQHFRKKIDWESSKTAEMVRKTAHNPMDTHHIGGDGQHVPPAKRFTKPKCQFDAESVMKSLGITEDDLENLQQSRKAFDSERCIYTVAEDGCTEFKTRQAGKAATLASNRIIPTSLGNTALGWNTTSRELLRNPGITTHEIVPADKHPAIARTTASLGFCVPHREP